MFLIYFLWAGVQTEQTGAARDDKKMTVDTPGKEAAQWAAGWLDGVADGTYSMSQRKRSSVETRGGGLEAVKVLAVERGVHLLLLEDDRGNELVTASAKPFSVIC